MIPTLATLALLADSTGESVISGIGGIGVGSVIGWYMLTKWSPNIEEKHRLQLAELRADLLALAATERQLAERIVEIFAKSQGVTLADNQRTIVEVKEAVAETNRTAAEILDEMRSDKRLEEELTRSKDQVEALRKGREGSDLRKRNNNRSGGEPQT
jgi:hypothetical protein